MRTTQHRLRLSLLAALLAGAPSIGLACNKGSVKAAAERMEAATAAGNTDEVERTMKAIVAGAMGGVVLGIAAGSTGKGVVGLAVGAVVGGVIGAACGCGMANKTVPTAP